MSDNIDNEILNALRNLNSTSEQQNKSLAEMNDGIIRILERQDKSQTPQNSDRTHGSRYEERGPFGLAVGISGILVVMIASVALSGANAVESLAHSTDVHRASMVSQLAQERSDRIKADEALNEASKDRHDAANDASISRHDSAMTASNQMYNSLTDRIGIERDEIQAQLNRLDRLTITGKDFTQPPRGQND